jgi:dihydrofolate synthase/folylpolyglutamate synthase
MTYEQARNYLFDLPSFGQSGQAAYRPGFARIQALLELLGHPEARFPAVHVAGTNGKGSTASMIAAVGTAMGLRTGLHTSPHLFSFTERMRIDGVPADRAWIAREVGRNLSSFASIEPSFFEASVALSLAYFADRNVDIAVVEVGLGGRLDATNVLSPELGIITHIGFDHTQQLGSSIASIAREKAGIIKDGMTLIAGYMPQEASRTIEEVANRKKARMLKAGRDFALCNVDPHIDHSTLVVSTSEKRYSGLELGLGGEHQASNATAAIAALECLFGNHPSFGSGLRTGLRDVRQLSGIRGRLELLHKEPLVVADVAHNAEGLMATLDHLRSYGPVRSARLEIVLGLMRDKPVDEIAALLADSGVTRVYAALLGSPRALPPEKLVDVLGSRGVNAECTHTVRDGISRFFDHASPEDALLITGSHFCVAQLEGITSL